MNHQFLLVTGEKPDPWSQILIEAISPLGGVKRTTEGDSLHDLGQDPFALVIIDSAIVHEPTQLILDLLSRQPNARIVVFTLSPTWTRALKVIQAGALRYIPKSMVKQELRRQIEDALKLPVKKYDPLTR